jgi:hypothetical protein
MKIIKQTTYLVTFNVQDGCDIAKAKIDTIEEAITYLEFIKNTEPHRNWKIVCTVEENIKYENHKNN